MFDFFERRLNPFSRDVRANGSQFGTHTDTFLWNQIFELRRYILLVAAFSAGMAFSEVYLFSLLGGVVDLLATAEGVPRGEFFLQNKWVFIKACLVLFVCLPFVVSMHSLIINQTLHANLQTRIMSRTNELLIQQNLPYFTSVSSGKLATTVQQLSTGTRYVLLKVVDIFIYLLVFFVSASVMIIKAQWVLLVPVCLWLLGYACAMTKFIPELKRRAEAQSDKRSDVSANMVDVFSNIQTVKLFMGESHEVGYSNRYISEYLKSLFLQMRTISKIAFTNWTLNIALIFSSGVLCLYSWSVSAISVGVVSSVIALILRLYTTSFWIIWEVSGLSEQLGAIKNSLSLIKSEKFTALDKGAPSLFIEGDHSISFNSVRFGFDESKYVFEDLNLSIKNKEKIGIVGESGSGKSTLVKLLLGFYPANQGTIEIGGKNISSLSYHDIALNISVVTQDVELLNRSIYQNIVYGANGATLNQVIEASKLACAHDFISELEDGNGNKGYDYVVGEKGGKLSGGQKQRIALARAILKNAPILIFDEATSALDSVTEATIVKNLTEFIKDKTFIFITHRMINICRMDKIAVMQSGHVAEIGRHETLMENNGIYSALWNAQTCYSI
jgi:ATP-binding cassette subfamily B protein/ATP-binding cassette subfamily B multidrug efflux pump